MPSSLSIQATNTDSVLELGQLRLSSKDSRASDRGARDTDSISNTSNRHPYSATSAKAQSLHDQAVKVTTVTVQRDDEGNITMNED